MKRRVYSTEFKKETVRQVLSQEVNKTHLVESIGISRSMLYRWIDEFGPTSKEKLTDDERSELAYLRKAHKRLEMEHEILKKAISLASRANEGPTGSSKR